MNYSSQTIEIKEIILLTGYNEITVFGTVHQNTLSYPSQISINSTQLNKLINQLQRKNPDNNVVELFENRVTELDQMIYYLGNDVLTDMFVELDAISENQLLQQIRA